MDARYRRGALCVYCLVKGETVWVFVNVKTGMPHAIPDQVSKIFIAQER